MTNAERIQDNNAELRRTIEMAENLPDAGSGGEDVTSETNEYTAKLEVLETAITELESELKGKASGEGGNNAMQVITGSAQITQKETPVGTTILEISGLSFTPKYVNFYFTFNGLPFDSSLRSKYCILGVNGGVNGVDRDLFYHSVSDNSIFITIAAAPKTNLVFSMDGVVLSSNDESIYVKDGWVHYTVYG